MVVVWYHKAGSDGLKSGEGKGGGCYNLDFVSRRYMTVPFIIWTYVIKEDETQEGALQYNPKSPPKRRDLGEN